MPSESAPTCIYCPSTVPPTKREHVMSQAMGTFEQNWTLDCVCDECNHYFSGALELALGRDSVEAFLRVEYGVKPPHAVNNLLNKRMKATLAATGVADGARVLMKAIEEAEGMFPDPP